MKNSSIFRLNWTSFIPECWYFFKTGFFDGWMRRNYKTASGEQWYHEKPLYDKYFGNQAASILLSLFRFYDAGFKWGDRIARFFSSGPL
jgi:hypothetical protein